MGDMALIRHLERTWALDAAALADAVNRLEPSWGSETFDLADGKAVLSGPGLYVNQVIAAGLDHEITDEHLELLERRCRAVGVPAAFEVGDATLPSVRERLIARGYVPRDARSVLVRRLHDWSTLRIDAAIAVALAGRSGLRAWQDASARGWGHFSVGARRASDAFAAAAALTDKPGLMLARSASDGRPLGCASLTVTGKVATLAAMSTLPDERGRGVQGAMIRHRLRLAGELGCELAASTTKPGSESERNLIRHGFEPLHVVSTFAQEAPRVSREDVAG